MPRTQRSSDLVEIHSEKAISYGFGGLVGLAISALLLVYRGDGMFVPLALIIGAMALGALGVAAKFVLDARKVTSVDVKCPYCSANNRLVEVPDEDFTCIECHRLIPIKDGLPMTVSQVRCGFCNTLNYFSDKTEILLCESCNHEIPISQADGRIPTKKSAFAVKEDDSLYELILIAHGTAKTEELIATLQSMLALNRNQVKQLLGELPVTLLTGITRKKAEMLAAQLTIHEGLAEFKKLPDTATLR